MLVIEPLLLLLLTEKFVGAARDQGNSSSREARVRVLKVVCVDSLFSHSILSRPQVSLLPRPVPSAAKLAISAKREKHPTRVPSAGKYVTGA